MTEQQNFVDPTKLQRNDSSTEEESQKKQIPFSSLAKFVKYSVPEKNKISNEHLNIAKIIFSNTDNVATLKKRFSIKLLGNMYIDYKFRTKRYDDNRILIKEDYFKTSKSWKDFVRKHPTKEISANETKTTNKINKEILENGEIIIKEEIANKIRNYFDKVISGFKEKIEEEDESESDEGEENFIGIGSKLRFNKNSEIQDFIEIFKDSTKVDYDLQFNEDVEVKENWNVNDKNVISTHKIRIRKRLKEVFRMSLSYGAKCPVCEELLEFNYVQLSGKDIGHLCPQAGGDNGKVVKLNRSCIKYLQCKDMYCYECEILNDPKMRNQLYHFFSLNFNLKRGNYMANIITDDFSNITPPSGKQPINLSLYSLMLAVKPIDQEVDMSLFDLTKKDAVDWCKSKNIPYSKLVHISFMVRKYYKDYFRETIDNRGMLLQLTSSFCVLSKTLAKYRMFAQSVIGETSVSKTFIATRIYPLFDEDYTYISGGKNTLSIPGMMGGINNGAEINGQRVSMFEEGIVSKGSVVFDEAPDFYDMELSLNSLIKENFNGVVTIQKIGGKTAPITFTPFLAMNHFKHHDEYKERVRKAYKSSLVADKDLVRKDTTNHTINKIIKGKNLYLPEEKIMTMYHDKHLLEAICIVRMGYASEYRDWKTGGAIASANRLFFDIFVTDNREENGSTKKNKTNITFPNPYDLDTQKVSETTKQFLGTRDVDFFDFTNNTDENKKYLEKLEENAMDYVYSDDKRMQELNKILGVHDGNSFHIDPKLEVILIKHIMILQYFENPETTNIEEVTKAVSYMICSKLKRGITSEEYDLEDNSYKRTFDFKDDFSLESLQALMDEAEEEERIELQMKVDLRKEKEEKEKEKTSFIQSIDELKLHFPKPEEVEEEE